MSDRPAPRDNEAGTPPARPPFRPTVLSSPRVPPAKTPSPTPPLRGANIGCDVVRSTIVAGPRPDVPARGRELSPSPSQGEGLGRGSTPTPRLSVLRPGQDAASDRPIRVLIVDDSVLMRQGVRRLLGADPG